MRKLENGAMSMPTALVLLAATLAAAVLTGVATAQTVTETEVVTFPFTTALFNPCAGEMVLVVGTMHVQTHITAQEGRLLYETSTWSKDASAEATLTGARYVYQDESGDVLHAWFEQDRYVSKQRTVIHLVRLGEDGKLLDDDLFVHIITTTAVEISTGAQTVREVQFKSECR